MEPPVIDALNADPAGSVRLPPPATTVRRGRVAMTMIFFSLGALVATWAARIPALQARLHLSAGSLGLALLGPAVGLFAATLPTGALLTRLRARTVIAGGLAVYTVSLPCVALAGGTLSLFAVLLVWGVGGGAIDVAMNTEAASLEVRAGRPIMSGMHAAYSGGGLVGAGAGAVVASVGVTLGAHLLAASLVAAAVGIGALVVLGEGSAPHRTADGGRGHLPRLNRSLVALAAMAFGCFLAEGAASDWSAVYLHSSLGADVGVAALGYTVFAVAMTAGRLVGDRLIHAFGAIRVVRLCTMLAALGFGTALVAGTTAVVMVGLAVMGLGLSLAVPQVFSSAAALGAPGPSLALVTGCGYVGLMAGPPLIGGAATVVGLPTALGLLVVVLVAATALAGSLRPAVGTGR